MADIPSNIPGAPQGAEPMKKSTGKVQPKKETVHQFAAEAFGGSDDQVADTAAGRTDRRTHVVRALGSGSRGRPGCSARRRAGADDDAASDFCSGSNRAASGRSRGCSPGADDQHRG